MKTLPWAPQIAQRNSTGSNEMDSRLTTGLPLLGQLHSLFVHFLEFLQQFHFILVAVTTEI